MESRDRLFTKWLAATLAGVLIVLAISLFSAGNIGRGNLVIVLDPGHGGEDLGAVNYDIPLSESDLNLAMALACRDELLRYEGVEVYMTHEGLDADERMVIADRVAIAEKVGADIFISLHCNDAESKKANGAEIYVSHSTYSKNYRRQSTELAVCILEQFRSLGITVRGVKTRLSGGDRVYSHSDGTSEIGDYYGVIGETILKYNIPGILIEHGFVYGDSSRFDTAEELRQLGIADAKGIAEYYGLKLKKQPAEQPDEVFVSSEAELLSASDAAAKIIALPQNITANSFYKIEEARLAYSCLTQKGRLHLGERYEQELIAAVTRCDELRCPVVISLSSEKSAQISRFSRALYINRINGMTVRELKRMLTPLARNGNTTDLSEAEKEFVVYDKQGEKLKNAAYITTGCTVVLMLDEKTADELRIIITGDINGDGIVDSLDRGLLDEYLVGNVKFGEIRRLAADTNKDGFVTEADIEYLN